MTAMMRTRPLAVGAVWMCAAHLTGPAYRLPLLPDFDGRPARMWGRCWQCAAPTDWRQVREVPRG